jgi:regulator of ribosome biosynthesis
LEYTKSKYTIELPEPNVVLPREKPVPKPKQLTKWEKFR